jgi:hypothetical protein
MFGNQKRSILNKKGVAFEDSFFALALIFASAIFLVVIFYAWSQIQTPLADALGSVSNSTQVEDSVEIIGTTITFFDNMFPFFIIGFIFFLIMGMYFSRDHPILFFVFLFLTFVIGLLAIIFSNVYYEIINTDGLSTSANEFALTNAFMQYLPIIIIVIVIISLIFFFAKPSTSYGGGL